MPRVGGRLLGGVEVDTAFESSLRSLVGEPVYDQWAREHAAEHAGMLAWWQAQKRAFRGRDAPGCGSSDVCLTLPAGLRDLLEGSAAYRGGGGHAGSHSNGGGGSAAALQGKKRQAGICPGLTELLDEYGQALNLRAELVVGSFQVTLRGAVEALGAVLKHQPDRARDVEVMLVGGFCSSPFVVRCGGS